MFLWEGLQNLYKVLLYSELDSMTEVMWNKSA